jgi:small subunit ribosomal protein S8
MSMQDPISDMLTRIRNAIMRDKEVTRIPFSKYKLSILEVLKNEGFISNFEKVEEEGKKNILVYLKYAANGRPVLNKLERVSKPSCRQYIGAGDVKPVLNGIGISILSTSKGVLSDKQCREQNVGGEIICEIY